MAVLASPTSMDPTRQRSSPATSDAHAPHAPQLQQTPSFHGAQANQQLPQLMTPQQMLLAQQQQQQFPFQVQQQPAGSWTPNIGAAPFYPSFFNPANQMQPQAPYFDPANAQLAAQWAYQQMMFSAQHGYQPRPGQPADYFAQQSMFNQFPSGTPPPHRQDQQQQQQQQHPQHQYPGFHPYKRPDRQQSQQSDHVNRAGVSQTPPRPPYARPDASGSSSSVNSSSSRQRTNSNQSSRSGGHNPPNSANSTSSARSPVSGGSPSSVPARKSPSPVATASPTSTSPGPSPLRTHRTTNSASSTSTTTSSRPSGLTPSMPTASTSTSAASATSSRLARPSPLSQGTFTASEKRMSRDDIDLGTLQLDTTHGASGSAMRGGVGLKSRLKRALSFNAAQTLKEEEANANDSEDDDDESIKASVVNGKLKTPPAGKPAVNGKEPVPSTPVVDDTASTSAAVQTSATPPPLQKKKSRAASLFNSRMNMSTDNISLSSTVSSASVMIRKLGAMGKLARRNSLAGITALFNKDKDKAKEKEEKKSKKDKKTAKAVVSEASVSHVTAELDRMGADWSAADLQGLSPAAKLARQHTLKSNAEAAAKAKAEREAKDAAEAAAASNAATSSGANGISKDGVNGQTGPAGVATWDRNTATRQGATSPNKPPGVMVNEDGTRTLIEDDDDDESEHGHYQQGSFSAEGWEDDEDWDVGEDDEDVTIRGSMEPRSSEDQGWRSQPPQPSPQVDGDMEPWAVNVRRSVERTRKPMRGILKYADSYNQANYLNDQHPTHPTQRPRSNSYNSPASQTELGPLARIPSPDPDHIDGLHRHNSHSSTHGASNEVTVLPVLPPLSFDSSSPIGASFNLTKDLPHTPDRSSAIYQHPNLNSSAPALPTLNAAVPTPPILTHRSATVPPKKLVFASNLSVYDTFAASVYDRRSEPATWSRLTPALAQRIKEELNSYKMEEMEVHAASRIHTQFFV